MKIEDVPQDLKFFKDTKIRDIAYAVDNDGCYQTVVSDGWIIKNDAIDITWDHISENCENIKKDIQKGKISPLVYHMEKNLMSLNLLSSYTGISKRHIKKHMKPDVFNALSEDILQKYADMLRITVDELKKI